MRMYFFCSIKWCNTTNSCDVVMMSEADGRTISYPILSCWLGIPHIHQQPPEIYNFTKIAIRNMREIFFERQLRFLPRLVVSHFKPTIMPKIFCWEISKNHIFLNYSTHNTNTPQISHPTVHPIMQELSFNRCYYCKINNSK